MPNALLYVRRFDLVDDNGLARKKGDVHNIDIDRPLSSLGNKERMAGYIAAGYGTAADFLAWRKDVIIDIRDISDVMIGNLRKAEIDIGLETIGERSWGIDFDKLERRLGPRATLTRELWITRDFKDTGVPALFARKPGVVHER